MSPLAGGAPTAPSPQPQYQAPQPQYQQPQQQAPQYPAPEYQQPQQPQYEQPQYQQPQQPQYEQPQYQQAQQPQYGQPQYEQPQQYEAPPPAQGLGQTPMQAPGAAPPEDPHDRTQLSTSQPAADPTTLPADTPRILAGFLISYENNALGESWSLHQGRNAIGRQGAGTGSDIEIPHPTISSRHAIFYASARPGRIVLEDTGSTNGTFINENHLVVGQRQELSDGDKLRFGLFTAIVKII